jgi:hypothetical protein
MALIPRPDPGFFAGLMYAAVTTFVVLVLAWWVFWH